MQKKIPNWIIDRLPEYKKVEALPQAFSDSTHQLWRLESSDQERKSHFLKVCSNTSTPFWQVMKELFDFDLYAEIPVFSKTYAYIEKLVNLEIPKMVQAEKINSDRAFVLTTELKGSTAGEEVNDEMVEQLAEHLAALHSNTSKTWGSLNKPKFDVSDWSKRLEVTIQKSAQKWGGVSLTSTRYLDQALQSCSLIKTTQFVPLMLDLRWDQYLQKDGKLTALVDLDAFVFAPRELDFIILEYILLPTQMRAFSKVYSKYHSIPELDEVRPAYRLLLFYMEVLGESDLERWMNKGHLF